MVANLIQQLGLDSTFFLMMGLFAFFFLLCWAVGLRPLSATLVERDERMAGREIQIEKSSAELMKLNQNLEKQMNAIQRDASRRFAQIKSEVTEKQKGILGEAKTLATKSVAENRSELESSGKSVQTKLNSEIDALAKSILEQVTLTSGPSFAGTSATRTEV